MTFPNLSLVDSFWSNVSVLIEQRDGAEEPNLDLDRLWLSKRETEELQAFRNPQRRHDWLAGRRCGKELLSRIDDQSEWEILSRGKSGGAAPRVYRDGISANVCLTIAHDRSYVVAAGLPVANGSLGVDVVAGGIDSRGFAEMWFSENEVRAFERNGLSVGRGWAAKEAAFKALRLERAFRPGDFHLESIDAAGCRALVEDRVIEVRWFGSHDANFALARIR